MMSRGKGARHVGARIEHVADAHCAAVQTVAQAFTMEQLGDDVGRAFVLADVIDGHNVGMIESGGRLGFYFEPAQAIGIA